MLRKKFIFLVAGILCLVGLSATLASISAAPDAPAASYSIPWWTVDSGGGVSQGGLYRLSGTTGQPDPGSLSAGIYTVTGGFWSGFLNYRTFLPFSLR